LRWRRNTAFAATMHGTLQACSRCTPLSRRPGSRPTSKAAATPFPTAKRTCSAIWYCLCRPGWGAAGRAVQDHQDTHCSLLTCRVAGHAALQGSSVSCTEVCKHLDAHRSCSHTPEHRHNGGWRTHTAAPYTLCLCHRHASTLTTRKQPITGNRLRFLGTCSPLAVYTPVHASLSTYNEMCKLAPSRTFACTSNPSLQQVRSCQLHHGRASQHLHPGSGSSPWHITDVLPSPAPCQHMVGAECTRLARPCGSGLNTHQNTL
jgi:hypothetical protein